MSEKMTDVLARLRRDVAFREEFTKDPWAILTGVGIQRPATGSIEVSLVGTGEQTNIAFIGTGDESSVVSSDVDSTGNPNWCWPYRYYKLYNRCDHDLNLEVWAHPGGGSTTRDQGQRWHRRLVPGRHRRGSSGKQMQSVGYQSLGSRSGR